MVNENEVNEIHQNERQRPSVEPSSPSTTSNTPLVTQPPPAHIYSRSKLEEGLHEYKKGSRPRPLGRRIKFALGVSSPNFCLTYQVPQGIKGLDKYFGYSKVAAFQNSDPNFLQFRKFGRLHNEVLLHLQHELQELEKQLDIRYDWELRHGKKKRLRSLVFDRSFARSERHDIFDKIKLKLDTYDEFLLRTQQINAIEIPTKRNQNSLHNFMNEGDSTIMASEKDWVTEREDLAALSHNAERGQVNAWLEEVLNHLCPRLLLHFFRTQEQRDRTGEEKKVRLVSAYRLNLLLRAMLTFLGAALLLAAVLTVFHLQPQTPREVRYKGNLQIGAVVLYTLAMSASISILTKAKTHEVFFATAAFAAVLVVFMENNASSVILSSD